MTRTPATRQRPGGGFVEASFAKPRRRRGGGTGGRANHVELPLGRDGYGSRHLDAVALGESLDVCGLRVALAGELIRGAHEVLDLTPRREDDVRDRLGR